MLSVNISKTSDIAELIHNVREDVGDIVGHICRDTKSRRDT